MNDAAIELLLFDLGRVQRALTAAEELVDAVDLWIWAEEMKAP